MRLESRVRKLREGLVWVELSGVGRNLILGVVCEPKRSESERDREAVESIAGRCGEV